MIKKLRCFETRSDNVYTVNIKEMSRHSVLNMSHILWTCLEGICSSWDIIARCLQYFTSEYIEVMLSSNELIKVVHLQKSANQSIQWDICDKTNKDNNISFHEYERMWSFNKAKNVLRFLKIIFLRNILANQTFQRWAKIILVNSLQNGLHERHCYVRKSR